MRFATLLRLLGAFALLPFPALAQFTIGGVADKTTYNDTATLTVNTQAGYTYSATLNYKPIVVGAAVVVNKPDFYELRVDATNTASSAVTSQYLRFVINSSERVGTEMGLPPHTPFPVIQSSPAEFVGARLRVLTPTNFPAGYEIPVVAWVVDAGNHAVRANGLLAAAGQNSIQIKRGVGSGFLTSNQPPGVLNYTPSIGGISSNKPVNLEVGTVWTSVSGTLSGVTTWADQSRIRVTGNLAIPAGSSLAIGAGSIVLLNSGVNITNDGAVVINGSVEQPVIFMPNSRSQPWGGFFMRSSSGSISATGAIFVASGANPTGGAGHRPEQCLFLVDNSPSILLSDSAAIFMAGQLGHAYGGGTFTYTRFLMQHATTGGEYTGASFTVNDSAFIECPDDSVNFVDGDNDGLYLVSGNHFFTNTLFGWTKDDGIDSGGDGAARLNYESCWFEATFHEGNSLSGLKNTTAYRTVYFDCGQGIEDGYGAGSGGPTGRVENCVFMNCQSGVRHGDNYPSIGNGYPGFMTATNCIAIHNHRDLFGFNWRSTGWTNAYGQFFVSNNFVSAFDTNYPNNTLWNPSNDGWRLGAVGGVGRAGVGFGTRGSTPTLFGDGLPVGLSRFCTNEVRVDYAVADAGGVLSSGTLVFPAGLTRLSIPVPTNLPGLVRVTLANPVNADVTGPSRFYLAPPAGVSTATNQMLLARGSAWNYWDLGTDQGTAWRALAYNDGSWSNGLAQLGFGDGDEAKAIRRTNSAGTVITTFYFRRPFYVTNAAAFTNMSMWMLRDDGGVVYLNGNEAYRSPSMPQPPTVINYLTFATNQSIANAPADNTIDTATLSASLLLSGTNLAAVEIHQHDIGSSDVSFDFELTGNLSSTSARVSTVRFADDLVLLWSDPSYTLEEADLVTGPWRTAVPATSPSGSLITGTKFFRLRK